MSKMSELSIAVDEVRSAAQTLLRIADTLTVLFSGNAETPPNKKAQEALAQSDTPKEKPVTLEQVRAVLAEKSRTGHTGKVRALLEKHGASKLSEIKPGKYAALLKDAEGLDDG